MNGTSPPAGTGRVRASKSPEARKALIWLCILGSIGFGLLVSGFFFTGALIPRWPNVRVSYLLWGLGAVALFFAIAILMRAVRAEQQQSANRFDTEYEYVRPIWYWPSVVLLVWIPFFGTLITIGAWAYFSHNQNVSLPIWGGISWNWAPIIWSLEALYVILSLRIIMPSYVGIRRFLGMQLHDLHPGPHIAPFPFFWVKILPASIIQQELPGNPEDIVDTELNQKVPEGKVRPIFVAFNDSKPNVTDNPTKALQYKYYGIEFIDSPDRNNPDPFESRVSMPIHIVVQSQIRNPLVFAHRIQTVESLKAQLQDIVVSWVTRELNKMRARDAMNNVEGLSRMLRDEIEIAVGAAPDDDTRFGVTSHRDGKYRPEWGIEILNVNIKNITPSHSLNARVQLMAEARAGATATRTTAAALADARQQQARGDAEYELKTRTAVGQGDAAAIARTGDARIEVLRTMSKPKTKGGLGLPIKEAFAGTTMTQVAGTVDTHVSVGTEGMASLGGIVAAADAILNAKKPKEAPSETPPATTTSPTTPSSGKSPTGRTSPPGKGTP